MVDGVTSMMSVFHAFRQIGQLDPRRGSNLLDGGAPFYSCYETLDGKYVAAGAIETRFYEVMVRTMGLDLAAMPDRNDRDNWPELRRHFERAFKTKTRDEWASVFERVDACVSPVLALGEAATHPHNRARGMLVEIEGIEQPGPTPRFSRTPAEVTRPAPLRGEHTHEALAEWGVDTSVIEAARRTGALS
jgi:alpha-methylacyl-CoA racemase